jgi:hypothetical protein
MYYDDRGRTDACDFVLRVLEQERARKRADISGAANNPWDQSYRRELDDLSRLIECRRATWNAR